MRANKSPKRASSPLDSSVGPHNQLFTSDLFRIHWSVVDANVARALAPSGHQLLAVWPAPVNHDACFAEAGFTEFGDNEPDWHGAAEGVLFRVIQELEAYGEASLVSTPLFTSVPWYYRRFKTPIQLSLLQQAVQPMHWDSLPQFHARFGSGSVALRTGNGHFLFWLTLPAASQAEVEALVSRAALSWPVANTTLDFAGLLPSAV